MFYSNQRDQIRQSFFDVWARQVAHTAMEAALLTVMKDHPEYHAILSRPSLGLDKDFTPEQGQSNPFLHMGLHLSVAEQITTDRPKGISKVYQSLLIKHGGDKHTIEHLMMDALAEGLWEAQRDNTMPDEKKYIRRLKKLLKK